MSRETGYVGGFALLLAVTVSGCMSTARYVSVNQDSGIVAIPHNDNSWPTYNRNQAEELMAKKCPQGYVIEREEEVVVGQTQHVNTNTDRKGDALLAALQIAPVTEQTHQTTSVEDKTEWRIWFRARQAGELTPPVQGEAKKSG